MTIRTPDLESRSAVMWASPSAGLWVASKRGEHAGMVERIDGRYVATNGRGRTVGDFDDLSSAREAIDGVGDATPAQQVRRLTRAMLLVNAGVAVALAAAATTLLF